MIRDDNLFFLKNDIEPALKIGLYNYLGEWFHIYTVLYPSKKGGTKNTAIYKNLSDNLISKKPSVTNPIRLMEKA